jgi:hypothetical protein
MDVAVMVNADLPRVTDAVSRAGRRYLPYAFTEHGVAMLSSVLRSRRAVQMNILIIRSFVKLREMLGTHKELARKIEDLERRQKEHGRQLAAVYSIVKRLIDVPPKPQKPIGSRTDAQRGDVDPRGSNPRKSASFFRENSAAKLLIFALSH